MIIRFFKEWIIPNLKCDRIGHNNKIHYMIIRKKPDDSITRTVVNDYEATQIECWRCGKTEPIVIGKFVGGYTSRSMPDFMWNKMKENGYVIIKSLS